MRSKEWDGEGIPPIGTVCEYHWGASEWRRCEIVAYYLTSVVAVDVFDSSAVLMQPMMFRPIKTPEQIAAEERQQAIDEMMDFLDYYSTTRDAMGVLYDAGYRRTGVKK